MQGQGDDLPIPLGGEVELPTGQQPVDDRRRPAGPAVQGLIRPAVDGGVGAAGQVGVDDLGGEAGLALAVDHGGPPAAQGGEVDLALDIDGPALPGAADDQSGQPGHPAGEDEIAALAPVGGEISEDRHRQGVRVAVRF
jgi:hypothetical protein